MMIICSCQSMGKTGTGFTDAYAQNEVQTVTLTSDLAIWFLVITHCFVPMMPICAKLFSNPTLHDKVMGKT